MHIVYIGTKGSNAIEEIALKKIGSATFTKYPTPRGLVNALDSIKQIDRVVMIDEGVTDGELEDFSSLLSNRFPTARLVLLVTTSEKVADNWTNIIYSPFSVVTYLESVTAFQWVDLCTLPIEKLKRQYGYLENQKIKSEIVTVEQPKEEKKEKGGLFNRLKKKVAKPKKQMTEEDEAQEYEGNTLEGVHDSLEVLQEEAIPRGHKGVTEELTFTEVQEKIHETVKDEDEDEDEDEDIGGLLEQDFEEVEEPNQQHPNRSTDIPFDVFSGGSNTQKGETIPVSVQQHQSNRDAFGQEGVPSSNIPLQQEIPVRPLPEVTPEKQPQQVEPPFSLQKPQEEPVHSPFGTYQEPEKEQNNKVETVAGLELFGSDYIVENKDSSKPVGDISELSEVVQQTIGEVTKTVGSERGSVFQDSGLVETHEKVQGTDVSSVNMEDTLEDVLDTVESLKRKEEQAKFVANSNVRERNSTGVKYIIVTGDRYAGKTRTALKLAQLFANHVNTLYVDFDTTRKGSLVYLGIENVLTTANDVQLSSLTRFTKASFLSALAYYYEQHNFHCLLTTYGVDVSDKDIEVTQQLLTTQKEYSVVIVDCPLEKLHLLGDLGIYSSTVVCTHSSLNATLNTLEGLMQLEKKDSRLVAHIYKNMCYLLMDTKDPKQFKINMLYIQDMFDMHEDIFNWTTNELIGDVSTLQDIYKHL